MLCQKLKTLLYVYLVQESRYTADEGGYGVVTQTRPPGSRHGVVLARTSLHIWYQACTRRWDANIIFWHFLAFFHTFFRDFLGIMF